MKQSEVTKGMICGTMVSGKLARVVVVEEIQREHNGRKQIKYRVRHCRADGTQIANARELQPRSAAALRRVKQNDIRASINDRSTYRASYEDDGKVIYSGMSRGNLVGELPAGSWPNPLDCGTLNRSDGGDEYERARFRTPSGRIVVVEHDTIAPPST